MRRFYYLVLCLVVLLGISTKIWGETLTVSDGTVHSIESPIWGYYCDEATLKNQVLYPSDVLTSMSVMSGQQITKMVFYCYSSSISWGAAKFVVGLTEVDATYLSGINTTPFTTVYEGSLSVTSGLMTIEFETPYVYGGGNLLLSINITTKGSYAHSYFYGTTIYDYIYSYAKYSSSLQSKYFIPKTTFTYESATPITCPKPSDLTQTALSATSASFTWTAGGDEAQWQYVCLPADVAINWSDAGVRTVSSPTATITGLTAQTSYKLYVRAYCAADDQSTDISKTFTTPCAGTSLPWSEDFESMVIGTYGSAAPNCWNRLNTNEGSYPYAYVNNAYGYYRGTRSLYFVSLSSKYSYMILPPFDAATNTLEVSFWYRTYNTSTSAQFSIGYITDITDESTFTLVGGPYTRTTTITQIEDVSFSAAPAGARIAFRYGGSNYDYGMLDDIEVSVASSCTKPSDVAAVTTSSSSANISWVKHGTETAWNLQYSSDGGSTWTTRNLTTSNVTISGDNCSYTLTGLSAETTYMVRICADCGGGSESAYTSNVSFTTPCPPITTLPWSEDCESGTANTILNCWNNSGSTSARLSSNPEYIWGVYSSSGNKMLRMYNFYVEAGTALINSPSITLPSSPAYKLCFDYAHNASCGAFNVKISVDGGLTFSTIATYTKGSGSSASEPGTFTNATINLSSYAGQTIILQFYATADYSSGAIFIDNLEIKSSLDCSAPEVSSISEVTATSAKFTWGAKEGVTTYQYCVVGSGSSPNWSGAPTTSNTYATVTGLTPGDYDFYVRCICGENPASDAFPFTLSCYSPGTPKFSSPKEDGGRVSWSAASDVTTYQYCIVPGGAPADWSGNLTTSATMINLSGLTLGNTYTFYVRSKCAEGIYSDAESCYVTPAFPTGVALHFFDDGVEVYTDNVDDGIVKPLGTYKSLIESETGHEFSACDGYEFYGWRKDSPLISETSSSPGTVLSVTTGSEDIYLYAVYSKTLSCYTKITTTAALASDKNYLIVGYNSSTGTYHALSNTNITRASGDGPKEIAGATTKPVTVSGTNICDPDASCVWNITGASYTAMSVQNVQNGKYLYFNWNSSLTKLDDLVNSSATADIYLDVTDGKWTIRRSSSIYSTDKGYLYFSKGTTSYGTNTFLEYRKTRHASAYYGAHPADAGVIYIFKENSTTTTYISRCSDYTVNFAACADLSCGESVSASPTTLTESAHSGVNPNSVSVSISCPSYWTFVGWSLLPYPDETKVAPSLVADNPFMPYYDGQTLYAVYRHKTRGVYDYWSSYPVCIAYTVGFDPGNGKADATSAAKKVKYIIEPTANAGIVLPEPVFPGPCTWVQQGWLTEPYETSPERPEGLIAAGSTYYPESKGEMLYAVYKRAAGEYSTYPVCEKCTLTVVTGDGTIVEKGVDLGINVKQYVETSIAGGMRTPSATYPTDKCDVWSFQGWSKTRISGPTTIEPTISKAEKYYFPTTVKQDTLFAVYRRGTAPNYIWTTSPNCDKLSIELHAHGKGETDAVNFSGAATKKITESMIGAGLAFTVKPDIECSDRWEFAGWQKSSPVVRKYSLPEDLFTTGDSYTPTIDNEVFYAVYAHLTEGVADYWTSNPDCQRYTVRLHTCDGRFDNGKTELTLTETSAGAGVVLPTPTALCSTRGWTFQGWLEGGELASTDNIDGLTLYPAGSFVPRRNNMDLYAVYTAISYRKVTSTSELNTTDTYVIGLYHDYDGEADHTDFAVSNYANSNKTNYLNLEPIESYADDYGRKYLTNPSLQCQWKLVKGVSEWWTFQSVDNNYYIYYDETKTGSQYHTFSRSATKQWFGINVAGHQLSTPDDVFTGVPMEVDMADIDHESFYMFITSSTTTTCDLYKYYGSMYSSAPHCSEYTVYFDACDGEIAVTSRTESSAGMGVVIPTVSEICSGWELAGWSTKPQSEMVLEPETEIIAPGANYVPIKNNTTLYAVYMKVKPEFERINTMEELQIGNKYVIVNNDYDYALSNSYYVTYGIARSSVSIVTQKITNPASDVIWQLVGYAGAYKWYNPAANKYLQLSGANGEMLQTNTDDNFLITCADNAFYVRSNLESTKYLYPSVGSYFYISTTAGKMRLYVQKVEGYWSYPCSTKAEPMRWGDGYAIVESLTLAGAPTGGTRVTSNSDGTYTVSHNTKPGSRLRISWDGGKYTMVVPYIVSPSNYPSIEANSPTKDLVILSGAQYEVGTDMRLHSVSVYDGGELIINAGATLTIDTLIMRTEGDSTAPSVLIGDESAAIVINSNIIYHDKRIDDRRYYFFDLPYNSALKQLRYSGLISEVPTPAPIYYTDFWLKYYDGVTRADDAQYGRGLKSTYWTHVVPKTNLVSASTFTIMSGKGYNIALSDKPDVHKKRTLRFRMSLAADWNDFENGSSDKVIDVDPSKAVGKRKDAHSGWNLIGNPYLHTYYPGAVSSSDGLKTGHYILENGYYVLADDETRSIPYLTYFDAAKNDYYQTRADNSKIDAYSAVFVQIEDDSQLMFTTPMEARSSMPAYQHAPAKEQIVNTGISLYDEQTAQSDEAGLVISNQYTNDYEIGADLLKMMSGKNVSVYTIDGEYELAFNALDSVNASNYIPVGIFLPSAGSYIFAFDDIQYDASEVEHVWLTDYQESISTDLLLEDYYFDGKAGIDNTRFALSVTTRNNKYNIATGKENAGANQPSCYSVSDGITICNLSEPTDILVFDMTGKTVYSAQNITGKLHCSLNNGAYNILLRTQSNQTTLRCIVR